MAITSTGYQAPATSRQGLKPSVYDKIILIGADEINYTRAYNGGADVDPRLAGQGIFYALEKDIAAQAYTPEIYAARLKQRGFSNESAQAFTQAYIQKDINIAKDYANGKAAEVYESNVRAQVSAEIKAKNEIEGEGWTMRDGGEANLEIYEGNGVIDFSSKIDDDFLRANATELEPSSNLFDFLAKTKNNPSRDKILNHFADKAGERDSKALDHRMAYLNYIMPTIEEPLIKIFRPDGRISNIKPFVFTDVNSKTKNVNFLSIVTDKDGNIDFITAYALKDKSQLRSEIKKGIKVEVRRGLARTFDPHSRVQVPSATDEIISQKGNLVNEKETNGLRDSVSSVGDNASRAGGRQASDEQILRQGRRDTTNASQTKRPAQSDEQVEQQWAAKADGEADAAAATKQMVEKQGSSASVAGGLAANSNAHLGSGLVAGSLNSIDEDGNFSPERFAAGFLAGLAGGKAVATGLRKMTPKLYNKILGAAEKMPQMASGNPRLLGKLYSNGKDVSLNSFAGEKAITANVGKLDQAKAMLEKGADEVEIWQKTGWFKDKDGAWKFEIGDSNARLNPGFQSGGRLGELLDHEELFKAYPELKDVRVVKIGDETPDGAALSVKDAAQREKRGIYNVAYNDKTATLVRQDLQKIDDALILEKGSNKKGGAVHIKKHLDPGAQGAITQDEFLSVGKNIREYLQKYKEPFIDESGGRIYEWADGNGVKFRVVVYEKADGISASHPNSIISFYSNRNLKKPMEFRNPQVKYDVNLKEWHKGSSAITKNADGSPKVFYHGSNEGGLNIFKRQPEGSGYGFWFTTSQKQANEYASAELIPGYLKITKPFEIEKINDYDTLKNIFGLSEKAFKEFQSERQIWRKAMEKLRVREFRIADKDHLGFMLYDKNGDYVQTPNQMLVHDVHTLRDAGNDELAHFVYDKYYDRYVTGEVDVLAAVLNKNDYDVGKNFLRNKLKKAGYDGIKIDDNVIVVFDSAQIKHVENNGNFSDSPNIYKSGAEGYYSPAKNEIGLSNLGDKSTLMHEVQHAIQEIEDFARGSGAKDESYRLSHGEAEARNVQNRLNLDGKAHPHETFDVNPNETIVSKEDGINLSKELEKKYILKDGSINEAAVRKEAEPFIEKEYSLENFKAEFPNGKVDTPIGEVAVSNYQFEKLNFKGREKYLGLIKPTLERPAFVVDFEDTTFFFKPFRDKDGVVKFASIIKERDGGLDVTSNYPMANRKFELITREGKVRYVQGSVAKPVEHSLDGKGIIQQNEEKVYHSRKIEEIKREHPNVERELDESIAAMRRESFNDSNFKAGLMGKFDTKEITTQELGKSVNLSDKQLVVLKNDIKNADFKVINESKIYFDKIGKDGDKKRFSSISRRMEA
nr:LPD23 domain-containing protein [uncultured Campylobacter sp.]